MKSEWNPLINKTSSNKMEVTAHGALYGLQRRIQIFKDMIQFEDLLTNLQIEPVGLIVQHHIMTPSHFKETFTPNGAENPTIFLASENDAIGIAVQDNISRLRFLPTLSSSGNEAFFQVSDFALDEGKDYALRWAMHTFHRVC